MSATVGSFFITPSASSYFLMWTILNWAMIALVSLPGMTDRCEKVERESKGGRYDSPQYMDGDKEGRVSRYLFHKVVHWYGTYGLLESR